MGCRTRGPVTPNDAASSLPVASVALDESLCSPKNVANRTLTSRAPEARPLCYPTTSCPLIKPLGKAGSDHPSQDCSSRTLIPPWP